MERETRHLLTAVQDMKNGIRKHEANHNDRQLLVDGGNGVAGHIPQLTLKLSFGRGLPTSAFKTEAAIEVEAVPAMTWPAAAGAECFSKL
jgi:hypothetical protein